MASKRKFRRRSCENKERLTEDEAKSRAAYLRRHGSRGRNIHEYECTFCGQWHVGRRPRTGLTSGRRKYSAGKHKDKSREDVVFTKRPYADKKIHVETAPLPQDIIDKLWELKNV